MEATDGFYIQMPSQTNSTNILVGEITYLQIRCAIKRSRILNRPFANIRQEQTKFERTKIPHKFVGAGALDSPIYINVFSGRRRRRPLPIYRETVHFFSAKGVCEHNTGGASPYPTEIERDPLFVRRRMIERTRIRTPHPSAFGCHLPPLGKAFGRCKQRCGGSKPPPYNAE